MDEIAPGCGNGASRAVKGDSHFFS
jgi:hypothetical protein